MLSAGSRDLHTPVKYKRDIILKLESLASGKLRKTMHNHIFEGGNTESDFPPDAPCERFGWHVGRRGMANDGPCSPHSR